MKDETLQLIPQKYKRIVRNYYEELYAKKLENLCEVDKFLEKYNLPELSEEADNLNRPITPDEIEAVIKKTPNTQKPWIRWFHRRIIQSI